MFSSRLRVYSCAIVLAAGVRCQKRAHDPRQSSERAWTSTRTAHQPAILRWHVADTFFGCGGAADPGPVLLSRLTLAYLNGLDGCPASSLTGGGGGSSPPIFRSTAQALRMRRKVRRRRPQSSNSVPLRRRTLLHPARPRANRCPLLYSQVAPTLGAAISQQRPRLDGHPLWPRCRDRCRPRGHRLRGPQGGRGSMTGCMTGPMTGPMTGSMAAAAAVVPPWPQPAW
jgi:hypothetical protein